MQTLQRAMFVPDDIDVRPSDKLYPSVKDFLQVNPDPKPKKKKKGKKGKKK